MFSSVQQACRDYYGQIPENTLRSIGLSAVMSFTASVFIVSRVAGKNQSVFSTPVLAAAIAVAASTVQAVTTPLFNYLFGIPPNEFHGFHQLIKHCIVISLTQILFNRATSHNLNLINTAIDGGNENFYMIDSTFFKSILDITARAFEHFGIPCRQLYMDSFGLDFHSNPNPIYLAL